MWMMKHSLMNQAGSESGAAGAATAATGAATQGSATPGTGAGSSVLAQGQAAAKAAGGTTETGSNPFDWMPEKHRVLKDGTQDLDVEASARKLAESYRSFEKRFGAGDVPPKTADEYKAENLPDGITWDEIKSDPTMVSFIKGAHAKGMTNGQLEWALNEYLGNIKNTLAADYQNSVEQTIAALKETWKDQAEYDRNMGNAYRAAQAFAQGDDYAELGELADKYPSVARLLAKVGAELQEDRSTPDTQTTVQDWESEVAAIRANPGFMDNRHPEHKQLNAKITQLYAKKYGNKPQYMGGGRTL